VHPPARNKRRRSRKQLEDDYGAELPAQILFMLAQHLLPCQEDVASASAVCKTWAKHIREGKKRWPRTLAVDIYSNNHAPRCTGVHVVQHCDPSCRKVRMACLLGRVAASSSTKQQYQVKQLPT
jgi:hypothetical protein